MFLQLLVMLIFMSSMKKLNKIFLSFNSMVAKEKFFCFLFIFSKIQLFFWFMLFSCGCIAVYFKLHYFGYTVTKLNSGILLFLAIMLFLVICNDLVSSLIFWEALGIVSFFLILFYKNFTTVSAGKITLISSRFGDVGFFYFASLGVLKILECFSNLWFMIFCYFLMLMTKSAIFPFSSWLLEAMRAPTPVSCLVHSSTLVAAGIWFMLKFKELIFLSDEVLKILLVLKIITVFVSGVCACSFKDLKKIIALSTCSKMSWCFIYCILGSDFLCLMQLLSHGMAKCYMFMCVGDILSSSYGGQFFVGNYTSALKNISGNIFSTFMVILGVSGVPFFGMFYIKHFLISNIMAKYKMLFVCFFWFCLFLSYTYSFRLICLLSYKNSLGSKTAILKSFSMLQFVILSSGVLKLFFFYLVSEEMELVNLYNMLILMFQILFSILGMYLSKMSFENINKSFLFGQDVSVKLLYSNIKNLFSFLHYYFIYRWEKGLFSLIKTFSKFSFKKNWNAVFGSLFFLVFNLLLLFF